MEVSIQQPRFWLVPIVLAALIPLFLLSAAPLHMASSRHWAGIGALLAFLAFALYHQLIAGYRHVRIVPERKLVEVRWRSLLLQDRQAEFALDQFESVYSYVVPSRFPRVRVELLDIRGTHALLLAQFAPTNNARFWPIMEVLGEPDAARNLRMAVSGTCGVADARFVGKRIPGAQLL